MRRGARGVRGVSDDDAADGCPESVAADYDPTDGANGPGTVGAVVQVLADPAGDGPALELAVGTGRIAAPLAAQGVRVAGIELSRARAARIADKPGGAAVEVTVGDMTSTRVTGESALVYLVFSTISNVTSQDGQVDLFRNAAAHLRPGGAFLVEVMLPDLRRLPPGQDSVPCSVAPEAGGRRLRGLRPVRRGHAGVHVQRRHGVGRRVGELPTDPVPVRLARRDGSHGADRGPEPEAPVAGWGRSP